MSIFEITTKSSKSLARTGILSLPNGKVQTPVFMAIGTIGSVKSLTNEDLIRLNAEIILGNTYHLWLRPGMQIIARSRGLHKFIAWDRPILTDSGGFQAWSLAKNRKFTEAGVLFQSNINGETRLLSPEKSMQIQTILGSDIALVLDHVVNAVSDKNIAKDAMERTFRWAKRSKLEFERLKKDGINLSFLDSQYLKMPKPDKFGKVPKLAMRKFDNLLTSLQDLYILNKNQVSLSSLSLEMVKKGYLLNQNLPDKISQTNEFDIQKSQEINEEYNQFLQEISENSQKISEYQPNQNRLLFGIPQGAQFQDLRRESAEMTKSLGFPGYCIGGVAQGGEPEEVMYSQVLSQIEILETEKPKHLLGVGTPKDILEMVKRGIDMFDCVYPTRNARHGSLFYWKNRENFEYETIKIKSQKYQTDFTAINQNSNLSELKVYTKAYLNHLFRSQELLAYRLATLHNLEFYYDWTEEIRKGIREGRI
jgi:queuine/archaeosine tRNA-ribosyltransferase